MIFKGKSCCKTATAARERSEYASEKHLSDTKISEEEGEKVLQVPEHIPLQPMVKNMMRQAVPLQSMKVFKVKNPHGDIHIYVLYQQ